ncbi:MAG: hypothetical protein ACR5LG_03570 [Sodalis sp. (in: enterobacteria)]|uniref:hypothetical protein n=1 Tax=Sodalis sp. (in: enterobacteria) TaxID=1898979 RepID=UPI003F34CC00
MNNKTPQSQDLTFNSLDNIPPLSLLEHSVLPFGIKDTKSRFVYMNDSSRDFFNVPNDFDIEGRFDGEFPCSWSKLEPELQTHDRKAEQNRGVTDVIQTSNYGIQSILAQFLCYKHLILNNDNEACSGTLNLAT